MFNKGAFVGKMEFYIIKMDGTRIKISNNGLFICPYYQTTRLQVP